MDQVEREQYEVMVRCEGMEDLNGNRIDTDFFPALNLDDARGVMSSVKVKYPEAHGSINRVITGWNRGNRAISTVLCDTF